MVAGITRIAKVADEAAAAAKKAAELAKRRSKAAKKGAKTKAANRKAAEKAKARRSRGGKKAKKTKDKNIRAAEKVAVAEEKAKKAARQKEHTGKKPTQEGLPDEYHERGGRADAKHVVNTPEGAAFDPETGGSVDVARLVGTKGEKVSTGAGTRTRGFVDEQATKGKREVAKKYNAIAKKIDDKTATPTERKWFMKQALKDADAFKRQKGQSIKSRQTASLAQKRRAAGGVDNYRKLLDDGVVSDDMTINQIKKAIQNVKVRGELAAGDKNKAKRISEALIESRDQKKFSRPRKGLGQARGHGGPEIFTPKPRRRPMKRGGIVKDGHKDYRTGGMFY